MRYNNIPKEKRTTHQKLCWAWDFFKGHKTTTYRDLVNLGYMTAAEIRKGLGLRKYTRTKIFLDWPLKR